MRVLTLNPALSDRVEAGDWNGALAALGRIGRIDFNVDFDPRQDLLYEGLPQDPKLARAALALCRKAARRFPAEAALLEGAVRFAYREFPEARAALERAVRLARGAFWPQAWLFRAEGYDAMTRKDAALLRKAVARGEALLTARLARERAKLVHGWRAELYTGFDLHPEALADLDAALALDPGYGWAHAEKADIFTQQKRLEPALASCEALLRLHPKQGWAYAIRGRTWGKCGKGAEALADLDRAIAAGTDLGSVYAWRGEARRQKGDLSGALEDFAAAERLDRLYPLTYLWRGAARLSRGELAAAERDLSRSIALDPRNTLAFAWRAEARMRRGNLSGARADLEAFYPSNPRDVWTGGREGLAAELERAAGSGDPLGRGLRGRFRIEDPEGLASALEDLDAACKARPRDGWCRGWRAQALWRLGRRADALADLAAACRLSPRWSWAFTWRGRLLLAEGLAARALAALTKAVALAPELGEPRALRAEALERLGRKAQAKLERERSWALGHREKAARAGEPAEARP